MSFLRWRHRHVACLARPPAPRRLFLVGAQFFFLELLCNIRKLWSAFILGGGVLNFSLEINEGDLIDPNKYVLIYTNRHDCDIVRLRQKKKQLFCYLLPKLKCEEGREGGCDDWCRSVHPRRSSQTRTWIFMYVIIILSETIFVVIDLIYWLKIYTSYFFSTFCVPVDYILFYELQIPISSLDFLSQEVFFVIVINYYDVALQQLIKFREICKQFFTFDVWSDLTK